MFYSTTYSSPVGMLTLACDNDGSNLVGLWMEGQKYHGGTIPEEMLEKDDMPVFDTVKKWLSRYFTGEKPAVSALPLAPIGGTFRQDVWGILCEIPYGKVITYGDIAKKMAVKMNKESMSSQAVGGAVDLHYYSLPPGCGGKRQLDGVRWWYSY